MNRYLCTLRMRRVLLALRVCGVLTVFAMTTGWLVASGSVRASPQGEHCYDVGPLPGLPPDFCGCTWGVIYFNGQPVAGAQVTLAFNDGVVSGTTAVSALEAFPFYALHADGLGARLGDIVTITAAYGGQAVTRTVRLLPDSLGEQQLNFAFTPWGHWEPWAALPGVQALATQGRWLWAGTAAGLYRWEVATGLSETVTPGLASDDIRALAVADNGDVWVGTPAGVSRFHDGAWTTQATGLGSSDIRALATAADGTLYAGASHRTDGGISRFDGQSWQPLPDLNGGQPNLVSALARDDLGGVWGGTNGYGASRWDGTHWRAFTAADGWSADSIVRAIATEPGAVWFATGSYWDSGGAHGGVRRYDLARDDWRTYTQVDGLSHDDTTAVAIDPVGRKWFGTWGGGVSLHDGRNWWTYRAASGLGSDAVSALATAADGTIWAGTESGIARFVSGPRGQPPVILRVTVSPTITTTGQRVFFQVTANDDGEPVAAYDWRSDGNGPLGSEASFGMDTSRLTLGRHTVSVRVQNVEGAWSESASIELVVVQVQYIYLPLVMAKR